MIEDLPRADEIVGIEAGRFRRQRRNQDQTPFRRSRACQRARIVASMLSRAGAIQTTSPHASSVEYDSGT